MPVSNLGIGEKGIICEIVGGKGLINRLSALGVIKGKEITKLSAMVMRGPVVVCIGKTQIALGYRIAKKIIVRKD